ncbi:MAG: PIG-L deacetylase family protein [Patescibacteria group bacterium]
MKVLVITPHPDDETLGCGGVIKKYTNRGDKVYLCVGTVAYTPDWSEEFLKERQKELEHVREVLGIEKIFSLNFPSVKVNTIPTKELNDALEAVVREVQPEVVYLPHGGDLNRDHRLFFEAGLVATRPLPGSIVKKVFSYESLHATDWGIKPFVPNVYVDIKDTIASKIEAMKSYQSELKEAPHPRSLKAIEVRAQKRGFEAGLEYAEAFVLIREVI